MAPIMQETMNRTSEHPETLSIRTAIVSNLLTYIFAVVNYVVLCTVISLFGILANTINIIVFYRLGFKETINISFYALAISDLFLLVTALFICISSNPWLNAVVPEFNVVFLICSNLYILATRTTGWITTFVTVERCLCIFMPLKIKDLINPSRVKFVICSIFVVSTLCVMPTFFTQTLMFTFDPRLNRTVVYMISIESRRDIQNALFYVYSVIFSIVIFAVISVFTILLAVSIQRTSAWRSRFTKDETKTQVRDRRVVKMVTSIAVIYIVSYLPLLGIYGYKIADSEFATMGKLNNLFLSLISFAFMLQTINSSMNIFVYLGMSSKYRETFRTMLGRK